MMGILHHSSYTSFDQFTNKTSLSHVRETYPTFYNQCQDYHHCINNDICEPLKDYKSDNTHLFQQNLANTIVNVSEAFSNPNNLSIAFKTQDSSCIQTDFVVKVFLNSKVPVQQLMQNSNYIQLEVSKSSPFDNWDLLNFQHNEINYIVWQAMFDKLMNSTPSASKSRIIFMDGNYSWNLQEFGTGNQIEGKYKINSEELPKSSRKFKVFKKKMVKLRMTDNIIVETNWCNVKHTSGYPLQSNTNIFTISHKISIEQCPKSFEDTKLPHFRMLVQVHWIEWIKVCRIEYRPYTAIQYGYIKITNAKSFIT